MLDLLRKGIKPEDSVKAGAVCRQNKILIFANYMLGVPPETVEDLEMTYAMMRTIKPELHSPSYFSPIPGSDLYTYCKEKDLIKTTNYDQFVRNPTLEKIKGIDYKILDRYRDKIAGCRKSWWMEQHFAKHVLARWRFLLKKGYLIIFLRELAGTMPIQLQQPLHYIEKLITKPRGAVRNDKKYYPGT